MTGRVLSRLRVAYPESRSKNDLILDRLVAGSPAAIKKTLQRLESQQLIVSHVPEGSRTKQYKANLACGEVWKVSLLERMPVLTTDLMGDNRRGTHSLVPI